MLCCNTCIAWFNNSTLGGLDFADNTVFLGDSSTGMQAKTEGLLSIKKTELKNNCEKHLARISVIPKQVLS